MKKKSVNIAVIPARAGSKGIPNKNLQQIGSKNLIEHAIIAALSSSLIDQIIVTSDHPEIISIAHNNNVHARLRPDHMATDEAPVVPCLQDAVSYLENKTVTSFDNVILLPPTSPISTGQDIDNVIAILDTDSRIEGVVSVCDCGVYLPDHQYTIEDNVATGYSTLVQYDQNSKSERIRRQAIPQSYIRNGAIYAANGQRVTMSHPPITAELAEELLRRDTNIAYRAVERLTEPYTEDLNHNTVHNAQKIFVQSG